MEAYKRTLFLFLMLVVFTVGSGFLVQKGFFKYLEDAAYEELSAGNYLASVIAYNKLKEYAPKSASLNLQEKIEESERLLVAESNFKKAQMAAEEGDWLQVKTLLTGDATMINTSFKHYEDAINLFIEASEKVKDLEAKIGKELTSLKQEALEEKGLREKAEARASETKNTLEAKIVEKEKSEVELRAQITTVAKERERAEQEARNEKRAKFINELSLYVGMLEKGNGYLDSALLDVDAKKDTSALVSLSQGKALFDEVTARGASFLNERTPKEYVSFTQKLLQAASLLTDASRHIGNLVFYMNEKESNEFKTFFAGAKERRQTATALILEIRSLISSF